MLKSVFFQMFCLFICATLFCGTETIGTLIPEAGNCYLIKKTESKILAETAITDGTRIRTDESARAKVVYCDGSEINVSGESELNFQKTMIRMKKGSSQFSFKKQGKVFKVITPTMLIGVFGTEFRVEVPEISESTVFLTQGSIEAKALFGTKESVILLPGQKVTAGKSGLSKVQKINPDPVDTGVGNPPDSTSPANGTAEMVPAKLDQDLVMNGRIMYSVFPVPDSTGFTNVYMPFRLLIDGFGTVNGMKLLSSATGKLKINCLESGSYEFTILISGTSYSFQADINEEDSGFCREIKYHRLKFNMYIGNSAGNGKVREILNNLDMYITVNGRRQKVEIVGYRNLTDACENAVHLYRSKDNKDCLNLCFPSENATSAVIEFYYKGDLPVGKKELKLTVDNATDEYDIRL